MKISIKNTISIAMLLVGSTQCYAYDMPPALQINDFKATALVKDVRIYPACVWSGLSTEQGGTPLNIPVQYASKAVSYQNAIVPLKQLNGFSTFTGSVNITYDKDELDALATQYGFYSGGDVKWKSYTCSIYQITPNGAGDRLENGPKPTVSGNF